MAGSQPDNIVVVVADSLRYDSVHREGASATPYMSTHGLRFSQARSAGCWTLPATASMFTGLLPHEHGATSQTRDVDQGRPTLPELLKDQGYVTRQLTNNVATTHIFGLDRGFDDVERHWKSLVVRGNPLYNCLVVFGKPRMRRRFLKGDWLMNRMSEDLEASRSWVVSACEGQLDRARAIMSEHRERKEPLFLFVNLMDTHFPYQVAPQFELTAPSLWPRLKELHSLYHLVNQTHLLREQSPIKRDGLLRLRERQYGAWDRVASMIDDFVAEVHGRSDERNTVVFCSDHGDNFGEGNWEYHFSNVTDAGNRVPCVWLKGGQSMPGVVDVPVSMRDTYGSLCSEVGLTDQEAGTRLFHLADNPERSSSVTEAYWYNNRGKTRPEYRVNQFSFVAGGRRFVYRAGAWLSSEVAADTAERELESIGLQDAIEDCDAPHERKQELRRQFESYRSFSDRIEPSPSHAA